MSDIDLADFCKNRANITVQQLSMYSDIPRRTLNDWWGGEKKRRAVELLVIGIDAEIKERGQAALDMEYKPSGLVVCFPRKGPPISLSKETFVSCTEDGEELILVLHHSDKLHGEFKDHVYRVRKKGNEHVLKASKKWEVL